MQKLRGHIDFCMFSEDLGGLVVGGWLTRQWAMAGGRVISLRCHGASSESEHAVFYERSDLDADGVGFLSFFDAHPTSVDDVEGIQLDVHRERGGIARTELTTNLNGIEGFEWLTELLSTRDQILAGCEADREKLLQTVLDAGNAFKLRHQEAATGPIDYYGYHAAAGGWFFCGWIGPGHVGLLGNEAQVVTGETGHAGAAVVAAFERPDLPDGAVGVIAFVEGRRMPLLDVTAVAVPNESGLIWMRVRPATQAVRDSDLPARLEPLLASMPVAGWRDSLLAMLRRRVYAGVDTIDSLGGSVRLQIDEAIACGAHGLALVGWMLARPDVVRDMRVRCGDRIQPLDIRRCVWVNRPDVIDAVGAKEGYDDPLCGFVAFVPDVVEPGEPIYIEVRTGSLGVAYRNVALSTRTGLEAMKQLLGMFDLRFDDLAPAYDAVIGPAIRLLNERRLASQQPPAIIDCGPPPENPKFTVIIPMYGRIDLAESQMALLSAHPVNAGVEFLFILDEPARKIEARRLWASIYARFRLPCRLVMLAKNVGYGPANNIGLGLARGQYVVFLNSDVFPDTPDWLERLSAWLQADPRLGAVGPLLLYEDGSVQHRGMFFERLPEFGNWWFCAHADKGRKVPDQEAVSTWPSITGACMMMERALALELHGFDEAYAIGDFEDADLCFRIRDRGLACAVDPSVRLFHLERRSQQSAALSWRMNLTLYNAWLFQSRWAKTIEQSAEASSAHGLMA